MIDQGNGTVLQEREGEHLARLKLSNPGRLNSFTARMWVELTEAVQALGAPGSGVRCIIISGADPMAFAAGSDISEFRTQRNSVGQARIYGEVVSTALRALEMCEVPLIAQIEGACIGGGLAVASACDIRIAAESSRFGVPVNKLGLVMAHAEMRGLLRNAGATVVREVLLEGRIFSAQTALEKGVITRVVPDALLADEVQKSAAAVMGGAPLVARWHKRFIRQLVEGATLSAADLDEANQCFATADYRIGLEAFEQKAKPQFKGA